MKAETVHRRHFRFGGGDALLVPSNINHRGRVVLVHVLEDSRGRLGQRIGNRLFEIATFDPAHNTEAPDEIEIDGIKTPKREVPEIDVVLGVFVTREICRARRREMVLWHRLRLANQGHTAGS